MSQPIQQLIWTSGFTPLQFIQKPKQFSGDPSWSNVYGWLHGLARNEIYLSQYFLLTCTAPTINHFIHMQFQIKIKIQKSKY